MSLPGGPLSTRPAQNVTDLFRLAITGREARAGKGGKERPFSPIVLECYRSNSYIKQKCVCVFSYEWFRRFCNKETHFGASLCAIQVLECQLNHKQPTEERESRMGKMQGLFDLYTECDFLIMCFISCHRTHRALSFPSRRVPLLLRSGTRGASCGAGAGNGVSVREREKEARGYEVCVGEG